MIKKILLLIAAAFLCVACGNHKVEKGFIVGKNRTPRRVFVRYDATTHTNHVLVSPAHNYVWIADSVSVERHCVDDTTFQKLIVGQEYKVK